MPELLQVPSEHDGQGKKRRACDECRSRKLACTKEPDGCHRCKRENASCIYSAQKTMGRPRKRPQAYAPDDTNSKPDNDAPTMAAPAAPAAPSTSSDMAMPFVPISPPDSFPMFDFPDFPDSQLQETPMEVDTPINAASQFLEASSARQAMTSALFPMSMSTVQGGESHSIGFASSVDTSTSFDVNSNSNNNDYSTTAFSTASLSMHEPTSTYSHADFNPAAAGVGSFTGSNANQAVPPKPQPLGSQTSPSTSPSTEDAEDACRQAASAWLLTVPRRSCGCQARLYLALDSLQHLPGEMTAAIKVARNATHTAHDAVQCVHCSLSAAELDVASLQKAFRSFMTLGALLPEITNAYRRVLAIADTEVMHARATKQRLYFSLLAFGGLWGAMSSMWKEMEAVRAHEDPALLASGASLVSLIDGCMVEPSLWQLLVRSLLKLDVHGIHMKAVAANNDDDDGDDKNADDTKRSMCLIPEHAGLRDVVTMMEKRAQARYALFDATYASGILNDPNGWSPGIHLLSPGEKFHCARVMETARAKVDLLVIP